MRCIKLSVIAVILSVVLGTSSAVAGNEIPSKFFQNGTSASAIAAAVSAMEGCKNPLKFNVNSTPEENKVNIEFSTDVRLLVVCEEDDGEGAVVIGFQKREEILFPVYFKTVP